MGVWGYEGKRGARQNLELVFRPIRTSAAIQIEVALIPSALRVCFDRTGSMRIASGLTPSTNRR